MIYAIGSKGFPYLKFGRSKHPSSRVKMLQTGCPAKLELIVSVPWRDENEEIIHAGLADSRSYGEWYHVNRETIAVVSLMQLESPIAHAYTMEYLKLLMDKKKPKVRKHLNYNHLVNQPNLT